MGRETGVVVLGAGLNSKEPTSDPLNWARWTMATKSANGNGREIAPSESANGWEHRVSGHGGQPSQSGPRSASDYAILVSENVRDAPRELYRDCESDHVCVSGHRCTSNPSTMGIWQGDVNANDHGRLRLRGHGRSGPQRRSASDHENVNDHPVTTILSYMVRSASCDLHGGDVLPWRTYQRDSRQALPSSPKAAGWCSSLEDPNWTTD